MKSLKWEGNLFRHISTMKHVTYLLSHVYNKNECSNIMMIDGSIRHAWPAVCHPRDSWELGHPFDPTVSLRVSSVASLGWVTPGAATEGVTPQFFSLKTWRPFLVASSALSLPWLLFLKKWRPFFAHCCHYHYRFSLLSFGCHPAEGCHPGQSASLPPSDATALGQLASRALDLTTCSLAISLHLHTRTHYALLLVLPSAVYLRQTRERIHLKKVNCSSHL